MAHKIIHSWWTECSECGGNADFNEDSHIHGGLVPGQNTPTRNWIDNSESTLEHTNGCRAVFDEPDEESGIFPWLKKSEKVE